VTTKNRLADTIRRVLLQRRGRRPDETALADAIARGDVKAAVDLAAPSLDPRDVAEIAEALMAAVTREEP
jgi:hypothetical protein